jgi:hypothetical protein
MILPKTFQYGPANYSGPSRGITLPNITLYFSYETVIAYSNDTEGLVVSENMWGPTTGKHLNWISTDHKTRVKRTEFEDRLTAALHCAPITSHATPEPTAS